MKNKINKENRKNMNYKHITILALFMAVLLLFSLSTISAANQTINDTSTGGISQGITDTGTGDTLFLQSGTYNKTSDRGITISKNITIQGNGSRDNVIIDAQGLNRIFTISAGYNVTFINVTFTNGNSTTDGGAIYATTGTMTFINCTFTNNYQNGSNGGGAIRSGVDLYIYNCIFDNNTGRASGGALISNGGSVYIYNSIFANGHAGTTGGAIRNTGSLLFIDNCTFTNNSADSNAGAIYNTALLSLNNTVFTDNSGSVGGAIYNNGGVNFSINNCTFANNQARSFGGAIHTTGANLSIDNSTFINNTAATHGGAIRNDGANSYMNNCTFANNRAGSNGGAFYNTASNVSIYNSIFTDNNSTQNGGAIFSQGRANVTIIDNRFTNNAATGNGGAIYNNGNMSVSGNVMSGNSAGLGQMIYNNGAMGVLNLTFIDNSTWIVKNGSTITLYATLTDDMGNTVTWQNISFYLDGVFFENVTSIEGYANITYTTSITGDIPVSGVYAGNGEYNILINDGLLKVRIPTKITISVPKEVEVGDTITLESKLTDENGNPLAGKTVDFYVDGVKVGSGVTDSNGIAKLNYTFNKAGKPKVEVKFIGDNTYLASNATNQTTVSKIPTITTVETDEDTITTTLTDENGNPLANKKVTITINGKTYTKTTNSKGQVVMKYKNAWDYKVTANFPGDEKYLGSKATAPKRMPTKITIKTKGDKITATLIDQNGKPLAGKKITFRVKGVVIGVGITDANGQVVIYYKNADKNVVTASFAGDKEYGPSSATSTPAKSGDVQVSGKVAMKNTGVPIIAVLLALITSIGLLGYRKKEE